MTRFWITLRPGGRPRDLRVSSTCRRRGLRAEDPVDARHSTSPRPIAPGVHAARSSASGPARSCTRSCSPPTRPATRSSRRRLCRDPRASVVGKRPASGTTASPSTRATRTRRTPTMTGWTSLVFVRSSPSTTLKRLAEGAEVNRPRVVAIVQARLGSLRFPDKVLAPALGKPMIGHLLERLSRAEHVDALVLAVPDSAANDRLAAVGQRVRICRLPRQRARRTRPVLPGGTRGGR